MHGIAVKSGVNNCYWNINGRCTNKTVTRSKTTIAQDWDSMQNCTLTIFGASECGGYQEETLGEQMAMTKKERAEMQAAIDRADTLAALRWTCPVERDVEPPNDGYSEGWDMNSYAKRAWPAWSSSVVHGEGAAPKPGQQHTSALQKGRCLFSTRELALKAMRHEIELAAAADLMRVDRMIAAAIGRPERIAEMYLENGAAHEAMRTDDETRL